MLELTVENTYDRETEISTVRTSLVPSLDSGADRADDNGEVERKRVPPAMGGFKAQSLALIIGQLEIFEVGRVLRDQGASLDKIGVLHEAFLGAEGLDIVHKIIIRDVRQRVGDS